jgi:uncharacterized protein (TIGR04255 family)
MNDGHTMYRHPPVALVAAEIRFPGDSGAPIPPGVQRAFGDFLGQDWVLEPLPQTSFTMNLGAPSAPAIVAGAQSAIVRFAVRERTMAAALTAGSVTVETTRYGNWPQFRTVLERAIEAAEKLLRPDGITRIGVRFIDEVRVPEPEGEDWENWLSPSVLPPASQDFRECGWSPLNWLGVAQYQASGERYLVLRYGPQGAIPGFVVNPDGPLRRLGQKPVGPFFLLDFDAYWQPAAIPGWDSAVALQTCDQLHKPIRALFDEIITDRLITQVFDTDEEGE